MDTINHKPSIDFDFKKLKALQELMASITTKDNNIFMKIPTEHGFVELKIGLDIDVQLRDAVAAVFAHREFEYFGIRTPDSVHAPVFKK